MPCRLILVDGEPRLQVSTGIEDTGERLTIRFSAPVPLPEWAAELHRKLYVAFGHVHPAAELWYTGDDVLYLLRGGTYTQ